MGDDAVVIRSGPEVRSEEKAIVQRRIAPDAPLHVWLITVGEPLPLKDRSDRLWRTGLLAKKLTMRGHRVTWWTSTVDHFSKTKFFDGNVRVEIDASSDLQFLNGMVYRRNVSLRRYINHRQIAAAFREVARGKEIPDAIVCSLPTIELSAEAVRFGNAQGIPVWLDIRDLWPDEIAAQLPSVLKSFAKILLWPLYRNTEYALRNATGIVAISRTYLEWGMRVAQRAQGRRDRVFTHGFSPTGHSDMGVLECRRIVESKGADPNKKLCWFAGTFVGSIDLGTVIEAARMLKWRNDLQFAFCGSGERDNEWRERARGLGNVIFTGWADARTLTAFGKMSFVGLAAYKQGALMSLTNKLFEYLSYGLPVLTSLDGEGRALVEGGDFGAFYQAGSPTSLIDCLIRAADNDALRRGWAENARREFERSYSAESVYTQMVEFLEEK